MKIHSSFKDYYDSLQSKTDDGIKFVRETKELGAPNKALSQITDGVLRIGRGDWGLIGFCGRLIPFYRVVDTEKLWKKDYQGKSQFCTTSTSRQIYSLEEVLPYFPDSNGHLHHLHQYPWEGHVVWDKPNFRKSWPQMTSFLKSKEDPDLFRELDCPIFIIEDDYPGPTLTINPRLNTISFQKVVGPYQAFQELEMFIGSTLAKQTDPEVHISDELRAESHGFNKWSFRKEGKNSR